MIARGSPRLCDHIEFLRYPIDDSLKLLGKKWAGPVLMELFNGSNHFNALLNQVPGLNPRTLSARLDDFERLGIVRRERVSSSPTRICYRLTDKGEDMRTLLREVTNFSLRWFPDPVGNSRIT
jgi:DNA-binding HxlR family transcriptional regulator